PSRPPQTTTPQSRTPAETAGTPAPTPAVRSTPQPQPTQAAGTLPPGLVPAPLVTPTPASQTTPASAVASPSVSPAVSPATTPEQIAQLGPTPAAPVATTTSAPAPAAASVPLGTMLLRNWPVVLSALIVLAGLGLWVFARGGERKEEWPPAAETPTLKETPKTELPARAPVATQTAA